MFLKKTELQGFKSFASKVSFELSEGITGFVGPNGCGKSNIVDAVKWGLGEQRVSSLRGDSMQDVIFNGSRSRPPMNFAEVSLFFSNTCGTLPVDYEEVVVTRRLYRSGESEYLLNRTPCRLKDIRNLFLDTGIGVNAYSMMEQGRIDSILQVDPVSRRMLFEEAAGISRFKARRKEAERKLERTGANLLRVGDIIEELERRIRSLKNQAGRARSYLKYSERLQELKKDYYLSTFQGLKEEGRVIQEKKSEARAEAERLQKALEESRQALEAMEKGLELLMDILAEKKTSLAEVKTSLEETQTKIGFFEKRMGELEGESRDLDLREGELSRSLEEKVKNHEGIVRNYEELTREEEQVARQERRSADELKEAEEEWQKARSALIRLESSALEHTRREVDLKNKVVEAEARCHAAHAGLLRLANRQNALAGDIAGVLVEIRRAGSELSSMETLRSGVAQKLERSLERATAMEEEVRILDRKIQDIQAEIIKKESRLDVLEHLIERREGVGTGVKSVLKEAARESSHLSFIKGMLGELLEIDMNHSTALEAALGDTAEAVVVDDLSQARLVMEYINTNGHGRVTILPLSGFNGVAIENTGPGMPLAEKVICHDPALRKAVDALLGDVRLIGQEELIPDGPPVEEKRVTMKGDLLDRYGILSVGSKPRDPGVISRRSELKVLQEERQGLMKTLDACLERRSKAASDLECAAEENRELNARLKEQIDRIGLLNGERERHVERWSNLRREFNLNAADASELEKSGLSLKKELADLEAELNRIHEELEALEEAVRFAADEVKGREAEREKLLDHRRSLEFKRVQFRERREGVEKERRIIEENIHESRSRMEDLKRNRERLSEMRRDMGDRLEEMRKRYDDLLATRSELSSEATETAERVEKERETHLARKEALVREEEVSEGARSKVEDLRVVERENEVKIEALADKARSDLRLDLHAEYEASVADMDTDRDWAAVAAEIEEIRDRLARMGNVNLEAIHELEEVEARFTSLTEQRDDLRKSIKNLEDLIANLNRESRTKFVETFEAVRKHFNDIFRKLFQGGRADLRLREGEDVLEAGVEIIAGPPGKEVRSINLLSGGEKTLTAVGLLFALFKSRPSPFCILDEVDAALDEVNIERFCNLLGEYVNDSQFIIVTHSKRTMSYCDFLYGITMQESGISTRIALNLEAYEDRVA